MIIAGNWKMFEGPDPGPLAERLEAFDEIDAIVCPPYTELAACVDAGLTTFAQNVHWEREGAYTGEISAPMLIAAARAVRSSATRSGVGISASRILRSPVVRTPLSRRGSA